MSQGKWMTEEEYLDGINSGDKTFKLLSEYKNLNEKVLVEDEEKVVYKINARSLLKHKRPRISQALDKNKAFTIKLEKVHSNLKLVSDYITDCLNILVEDENGIIYSKKPNSLLVGSKLTIQCAVDKNKAFEIKARLVHGDKYDYSLVEYKGNKDKVKIICPEHGVFEQQPTNHISSQGQGCPVCCKRRGLSRDEWIEFVKTKDNKCYMYVIQCSDENENFIKVGITTNSVKKRFYGQKTMPYNYKILKVVEGSASEIWDEEYRIHKENKVLKYKPLKKFKGHGECFDEKIIEKL
jgi:hypothetical protein